MMKIKITFKDSLELKLKEMAEENGINISDQIRFSILQSYDDFSKKSKGTKKVEDRSDKEIELKKYFDQENYLEINKFLINCGYSEEPKATGENMVEYKSYFINFPEFGGAGLYNFITVGGDKISYKDRVFLMDIDGVINDLKKNKFI